MTKRVPARSLLVALSWLAAFGPAAQAQPRSRPVVRVRVTTVIKDPVSGLAWNALTEECARIWSAEGVEISWGEGDAGSPAADVTVPLVLDDRELQKYDPSRRKDAFGITLFAGRTQRVLVSSARVRELIAARRKLADSDDSTVRDLAAGRLLGRVVAHELGHVLLLTRQHAPEGLMSPSLTGRSLGPFEPANFALSTVERQRIATRFSNSRGGEQRADASPAAVPARGSTLDARVVAPLAPKNAP